MSVIKYLFCDAKKILYSISSVLSICNTKHLFVTIEECADKQHLTHWQLVSLSGVVIGRRGRVRPKGHASALIERLFPQCEPPSDSVQAITRLHKARSFLLVFQCGHSARERPWPPSLLFKQSRPIQTNHSHFHFRFLASSLHLTDIHKFRGELPAAFDLGPAPGPA